MSRAAPPWTRRENALATAVLCAVPFVTPACSRPSASSAPSPAPAPSADATQRTDARAALPDASSQPAPDADVHDAEASAGDGDAAPFDAAVALAGTWRTVPGAARFAQPNAPRVVLAAHADGPEGCGGGGCTRVLDVRVLRGARPAGDFNYFYSDRPGDRRGCFAAGHVDRSFAEWTTVEIAPAPDDESRHPACGLLSASGSVVKTWVILQVLAPGRRGPR